MTLDNAVSSVDDRTSKASTGSGAPYWKRKLPPVDKIALASLVLVVIDGVYMASYLPRHAPLAPVIALLSASGACLVAACLALTRIRSFAWNKFFLVLRWVVIEYIIEAGMLEYVFTYDHVRGHLIVILTLALIVFATDIPVIMAFTVARYQDPAA
ncbi:MAG: hypothetical protein M1399_07300 [Actinobacteria bacterium]|nr:hypothetical protein [Actinomycetota bacterium]MCL5446665.1 hypothetical protein [Actinomycetota bacterium]